MADQQAVQGNQDSLTGDIGIIGQEGHSQPHSGRLPGKSRPIHLPGSAVQGTGQAKGHGSSQRHAVGQRKGQ